MRTRGLWNDISLVAIAGICGLGCTVKSGTETDSGPAIDLCSGITPTPPPAGATKGPCDIYADDGGPCVAAHSTARALYGGYAGPLYQVRKTADDTTMDILPVAAGGFADAAAQDTFCGTAACTISKIYDQSGWGNHLTKAPAGMAKTTPDNEANAKSVSGMFGSNKVYGVHIVPGVGYRNNEACGTATGDNPQTAYMVVATDFFNGGCCFDYGNMERNSRDNGEGTMEAVYFGKCTIWGKGDLDGPWVMGDLENGLWAGNYSPFTDNKPVATWKYVTGLVKGAKTDADHANGHWAIKEGDAQSGTLIPVFDGDRPSARYNPMRKEGAIGLGTGGDNSNAAQGNWFEGVMTAHYSSDQVDADVQANIVAAYAQ